MRTILPGKNLISRAYKRLRSEDGQTIILAALVLPVLLGMLGLAIDVGVLRYERRIMQNAADAAAIAGALEITSCGSTANCTAMKTAAQSALVENGFTSSTLLTNCATRSTALQITVNNPPCAVSSDPNSGSNSYVEVLVSEAVPTLFARALGIKTVPVLVRAEAANSAQNCVYSIDPSSSGAVVVSSGTTVSGNCGVVVESTSSSSAICTSASVTAVQISLVGSGSASGCSYSPTPSIGVSVPSPADPLSSLATPTIGSCGTSTASPYTGSKSAISISGSATLNPGVYCSGITIKRGATVTFNAGTYILKTSSSNALAIDVGATVTGTGVTFYNCGSGAITFSYSSFPSSSGGVDLEAPTSGTYAGILFFQDSGNATTATILGTSSWSTILQGVAYFPAATVNYTYSGSAAYNALDAYDINFAYSSSASTGTSTFTNDYSSVTGGSPLSSTSGIVLVQ